MKTPKYPPIDYDSQFKRLVRLYFQQFMDFYMSHIYQEIDWSKGYQFLDKELEEIQASNNKKGGKRADFLVKVFLRNGSEKWILVHLEVQAYFETGFAERMFIYFYRTFDRHKRKIIGCAVYVNDQIPKNFDCFEYDFHGTGLRYNFNTFKVKDYLNREKELEENPNIFALVTLACLYVMQTKKGANAAEQRKALKFKLIMLLYNRGYSKKEISDLLHFIKFVITLPNYLEKELDMEVTRIPSTDPNLVEIPVVEKNFADWYISLYYGETVEEMIARNKKTLAKATAAAKAKATAAAKAAQKAAAEAAQKAAAQKELEAQRSVIRLREKLNLDAATIADVLGQEIKWVEKILEEKLKKD